MRAWAGRPWRVPAHSRALFLRPARHACARAWQGLGVSQSQPDTAIAESRGRNPEATAWYVQEAQRLLEDQQRRAESLRTRGGQIAGFGAAVLALIGGNVAHLLGSLASVVRIAARVELVAAAFLLTVAVATAIWGALRPKVFAGTSAKEIFRFIAKPGLMAQKGRESVQAERAWVGTRRDSVG